MKAFVFAPKDPGVGIDAEWAHIEFSSWAIGDDEPGYRERVRASLVEAFKEIFGDVRVSVLFEDEQDRQED